MASHAYDAAEVGNNFVSQYYAILQREPDSSYKFYTEASTLIHVIDGDESKATGLLQIHSLIMSLKFTTIEIKSVHSLDSWNGGVLVMASGSMGIMDLNKRNFLQTFFLAPQEKGYYVLNDVFYFVDDGQIPQDQAIIISGGSFQSEANAPDPLLEPVLDYVIGGEEHAKELVASTQVKENGIVEKHSIPDRPPPVHEVDNIQEGAPTQQESIASSSVVMSNGRAPTLNPIEQSVVEPLPVHDIDDIREGTPIQEESVVVINNDREEAPPIPIEQFVAEVSADPGVDNLLEGTLTQEESIASSSVMKEREPALIPIEQSVAEPPPVSEVDDIPEGTLKQEESTASSSVVINNKEELLIPIDQQSFVELPSRPTYAFILNSAKQRDGTSAVSPQHTHQHSHPISLSVPEKYADRTAKKTATPKKGEGRSVYVRNLPSTISTSDILLKFRKFGRIKIEGVVIRNRKDIGICYAFIEFEDAYGFQNAIKASPIQFNGRKVYIEERRTNDSSTRGAKNL